MILNAHHVPGNIGATVLLACSPADATASDYQARPEWYFLPLYQLLRVFQGREILATVVLPTAVVLGFIGLPLVDRLASRRIAGPAVGSQHSSSQIL